MATLEAQLRDEHVLKLLRLRAGERGGGRSEREEEVRDVVSLPQVLCRKIVMPAEGDHAALSRVAVELEVAEGQLVQERQERGLVFGADQLSSDLYRKPSGRSGAVLRAPLPPKKSNCDVIVPSYAEISAP